MVKETPPKLNPFQSHFQNHFCLVMKSIHRGTAAFLAWHLELWTVLRTWSILLCTGYIPIYSIVPPSYTLMESMYHLCTYWKIVCTVCTLGNTCILWQSSTRWYNTIAPGTPIFGICLEYVNLIPIVSYYVRWYTMFQSDIRCTLYYIKSLLYHCCTYFFF